MGMTTQAAGVPAIDSWTDTDGVLTLDLRSYVPGIVREALRSGGSEPTEAQLAVAVMRVFEVDAQHVRLSPLDAERLSLVLGVQNA